MLQTATSALVDLTAEYCTLVWCCSSHTRLIDPAINDALWIVTASYTSRQPSYPCRHLTCWALSQRNHTVSSMLRHGAWTLAPLSAHMSTEWEWMGPQIETHICAHHTTAHQFIWQHQTWGALSGSPMECGEVGQHYNTLYIQPWHWRPLSWNDLPRTTWVWLNCQSIKLPMDCTAWRFWMMRQLNGCSTPAPDLVQPSSGLKQLAQTTMTCA